MKRNTKTLLKCKIYQQKGEKSKHLLKRKLKLSSNRQKKIRSFQCDQCEYKCTATSKLTRHKRTHSKEKPFKCDQCEASGALKYHKRVHYTNDTN